MSMTHTARKMKLLERLTNEMDAHIWSVFSRYISEEKILFNCPRQWQIEDKEVNFVGEDGCRGCYDPMSLSIPLEFFINTENVFSKRKQVKEQAAAEQVFKSAEAAKQSKIDLEAHERNELTRLMKKYH